MKTIKVDHIEQLYWVLEDFFHFWRESNFPIGLDRKIIYKSLLVDFNQPKEMVIIQIHNLLSNLNFPVELEKIYWKYINS